ncbi:MAG: hypothetical protein EXR49_08400 [Dehalococcoidia bacterium]|nr:hypothetical protein [Dehalococcoidia bacterium]
MKPALSTGASINSAHKEQRVPAQTGKRYICEQCGAEVIVTRGGAAALFCKHGDTKVELKIKA